MNSGLIMGLSIYPPMWKPHDLLLAPLFLILIYLLGRLLRKRFTKRKPWTRKYFIPALVLRMIGCLLSIWMYDFYYGGGDMTAYYYASKEFATLMLQNPSAFFEVLSNGPENISKDVFDIFKESSTSQYLLSSSTLIMVRLGGLMYILSLGSIYGIGLILAFFSFLGTWRLYEVFLDHYPAQYRLFAYSILFIPSVIFWGSAGLMKDTVVLGLVGFSVFFTNKIFLKKRVGLLNFLFLILTGQLIFIIKAYVAISLIPCLLIWVVFEKQKKIKNRPLRKLATPIIAFCGLGVGLLFLVGLSSGSGKFNLPSMLDYAKNFQEYSLDRTIEAGGIGYDLGTYESSIIGLIKVFPKSVGVSLFRPFFWEAKKVILIPGAIESFVTLLISVWVLFRMGSFRSMKKIFSTPILIFCFGFSVIFSFAIGFTAFNFGTLARYKIIALPFYFSGLVILYSMRTRFKKAHQTRLLK